MRKGELRFLTWVTGWLMVPGTETGSMGAGRLGEDERSCFERFKYLWKILTEVVG